MQACLIPFLILSALSINSPLYAADHTVDFKNEAGPINGNEGLPEDEVGAGTDDEMSLKGEERLIEEDDDLIEEQADIDIDSGIEAERSLNEDDDLLEEDIDVSDESDADIVDEGRSRRWR